MSLRDVPFGSASDLGSGLSVLGLLEWLPDHPLAWAAGAVFAAVLLYLVVEARGIGRFREVPTASSPSSPYRSRGARRLARAPRLVRAAAFGCFASAHLVGPALCLLVGAFRSDGAVFVLLPGIVLAALTWCCGWLLLLRSPEAARTVHQAARATLLAYPAMLGFLALHLVAVEQWLGNRCVYGVPILAGLGFLGALALPQAALMRLTAKMHAGVFARGASGDGPAETSLD
jgi:hypothetical protein